MSQMSHVPNQIAKATRYSLFDRIRVTIVTNVPCPMSQSQTFTSPSYEWMSNIVRQSISRAFAMRGSLMRQYSLWHMRSAGKSVGGSMKSKGDQHGTEHPSQQKIVKIHAPCIPPERVRYALHRWRDGLGPRE